MAEALSTLVTVPAPATPEKAARLTTSKDRFSRREALLPRALETLGTGLWHQLRGDAQRLVLAWHIRQSGKLGSHSCKMDEIAAYCGLVRRSVQQAHGELEALGLLVVKRRYVGRSLNLLNIFTLLGEARIFCPERVHQKASYQEAHMDESLGESGFTPIDNTLILESESESKDSTCTCTFSDFDFFDAKDQSSSLRETSQQPEKSKKAARNRQALPEKQKEDHQNTKTALSRLKNTLKSRKAAVLQTHVPQTQHAGSASNTVSNPALDDRRTQTPQAIQPETTRTETTAEKARQDSKPVSGAENRPELPETAPPETPGTDPSEADRFERLLRLWPLFGETPPPASWQEAIRDLEKLRRDRLPDYNRWLWKIQVVKLGFVAFEALAETLILMERPDIPVLRARERLRNPAAYLSGILRKPVDEINPQETLRFLDEHHTSEQRRKSGEPSVENFDFSPFEDTWKVVLYSLAGSIGWPKIHAWLQEPRVERKGKNITLTAPNAFQANYVRTHFEYSLEPLIRKFYGPECRLCVEAA